MVIINKEEHRQDRKHQSRRCVGVEVVMAGKTGSGELRRVTTDQPAGFGTGSLLEVERVRIGVPLDPDNGQSGLF